MLPILQFSWRQFEPLVVPEPRVGDLYDAARALAPRLFVVHDPALRWTALAIPDLIVTAVERFDPSPDARAADVGLVDVIREGQVTVHQDVPATLVARLAIWPGARTVHVVDDEGVPRGLFVPEIVAARLPDASLVDASPRLRDALDGSVAGLPTAIAAIEAELTEFHSELVNADEPPSSICNDHGQQHVWWGKCPCKQHPTAACQAGRIAGRPAAAAAAVTA